MPELPEVETIVRGLRSKLKSKKIQQLDIAFAPTFWMDEVRATGQADISTVKQLVENTTIHDISRRGKMLIVDLSSGTTMIIHLKMTGQLIYLDANQQRYAGGHPTSDMSKEMPVKATRATFILDDGSHLYFNDQRKFGYIKIIPSEHLDALPAYASYGPEPLTDQFTAEHLMSRARNRSKITIKQFLLDQSVVAGIGNIYADESLFMTSIHPATLAANLSKPSLEELVRNIKQVLQFSIDHNGTSSEHYVTANGQKGEMQNFLQVYRRQGQACLRCGAEIERMVIGGRGTHYCPQCQKILKKSGEYPSIEHKARR